MKKKKSTMSRIKNKKRGQGLKKAVTKSRVQFLKEMRVVNSANNSGEITYINNPLMHVPPEYY